MWTVALAGAAFVAAPFLILWAAKIVGYGLSSGRAAYEKSARDKRRK